MAVFGQFLAIFGLILAMFLTTQSCNFIAFAQAGCRMTVHNFMKILWTFFEKFETFMKRSGQKNKKDTIAKVVEIFPD